jgi:hypothetical protein
MNIASSKGGGGPTAAQLFEMRNTDTSFITTVWHVLWEQFLSTRELAIYF